MKAVLFPFLLCMLPLRDQPGKGNPRYDFPESIIARNGPGAINNKMDELSISGYYHESMLYRDTLLGPQEPLRLTLAHKKIVDARALILQEARKHRILLINEAHSNPAHRLFTKSLLKDLYAQGYRVFMAEGIRLKNSLDRKGYPVAGDGYYISEPNYASLIRYAARTGYKVRAYEYSRKPSWDDSIRLDEHGSIKYISYEPKDSLTVKVSKGGDTTFIMTAAREQAQANNILKVIRENPGAKFIIHVGHGHLYESGSMMCTHLREGLHYKEEVLTIEQTLLSDRRPVIDTITGDTIRCNAPYLLQDNSSLRFFNYYLDRYNYYVVDYTLFSAAVKDSLRRPGFLFGDVEKRNVHWLTRDQLTGSPCLYIAYYTNEYRQEGKNAIAVDIAYITNTRLNAPLLLYKGKYTVVKKNGKGEYSTFELEIK